MDEDEEIFKSSVEVDDEMTDRFIDILGRGECLPVFDDNGVIAGMSPKGLLFPMFERRQLCCQ